MSELEALQQELAEYRRKRAAIQERIDAGDDAEYYGRVLAGWDWSIGILEGKIAREESKG